MSNPYYTHGSYPASGAAGSSAAMRAELDSISTGFDKLPTLAGNGYKLIAVNAGGTALEAISAPLGALEFLDNLFTLADNGDTTKKFVLQLSGITTGTTRTATVPDKDGTFAFTNDKLSAFAATTSAELAGVISDETGSGSLVFGTGPTIGTPTISGGTINNSVIGGVTPAAGTFTSLTATGNAALGDAEASDTHAIKGATTLLANSASAALTVTQTGAGNAFVVEDSASTDSTPFVIDANGRVVVGHTSNLASQAIEVYGASGFNPGMYIKYSSDDVNGPISYFRKSRGTTPASVTSVSSGDALGSIYFQGTDGTNGVNAALIKAEVDGTPGTGDMPGRLVFSTTLDGASSPTERMRITNNGSVIVGGTGTSSYSLDVYANTSAEAIRVRGRAADGIADIQFTDSGATTANALIRTPAANTIAIHTGGTERMRIDSSGRVGIGATPNAGEVLNVSANPVGDGSGIAFSIRNYGTLQSSVTNSYYGNIVNVSTAAAAFTLTHLFYHAASQGTIGSGSAVTNQYGFYVNSNLTSATNSYGVHSNIPSGSGRWNFYAAGTARNYFAGKTGVGDSTDYSVQGNPSITGGGAVGVMAANAGIAYFQSYNSSAGVDLKTWRWGNNAGALVFETVNDAYNSATERARFESTGVFKVSKAIVETKTAPTISTNTLTLDLTAGSVFAVSLNANITTLTISNPAASGSVSSFVLEFTADGTARTVTWPAAVKWSGGTAPTLTSTNGKRDAFMFYTYDGGTTYIASTIGLNF